MSGRGVGAEGMVTNFATDHHPKITNKRSQIVFSILHLAQSSLYPLHPIVPFPKLMLFSRWNSQSFHLYWGKGTIHKPKQKRFIPHIHALARVPKLAENRIQFFCWHSETRSYRLLQILIFQGWYISSDRNVWRLQILIFVKLKLSDAGRP